MRKSTLSCSVVVLLLLTLALTGCPNGATVQPEGGDKTPSNTSETKTEQIAAVPTSGKMEEPQTARDGSTTLTTTDSTGGRYTFTQPAAATPAASIRSAGSSPGGTWNYTNSKGIKQFEGKYSGDITSIGAGNLKLTVEKAADPSGKMQVVTSPQNFEFKVTGETFEATIPAVEIKVPVEPAKPETPPANTVELIKTVTETYSFSSGKDYYYDGENFATINFYSDKTFERHHKCIRTLNEVNFTFTVEGPCLVGTYTGDPSTDGTVTLNTQKWNKFLASAISITSPELTEVFTAYKNGETSKTVTITEAALTPYTTTMPVTISGDTFSDTGFTSTYTPNDNNSTTFTVEAVGDDADSFKLCYQTAKNNGDGSYSNFSGQDVISNLSEIITVSDAAENTAISPYIFIDKDGNGTMDRGTDVIIDLSSIDLKLGHHITAVVDIEKHSINFNIEGDTSQYQNIHVNAGYDGPTVPMADDKIDLYVASIRDSGSIRFINLTTQEYVQGESWNTYDISDTIELYPDEGTIPSSITFTLYDKLEEGKKIAVQEHPISEASTDEEKRFRFVQGTDGNIIFYIPTGTGSDGEFLANLSSSTYRNPTKYLIALTYLGLRPMKYSTEANMTHQFTGLVDNMKDVVWFLENRKGLIVEGKDLIGL